VDAPARLDLVGEQRQAFLGVVDHQHRQLGHIEQGGAGRVQGGLHVVQRLAHLDEEVRG